MVDRRTTLTAFLGVAANVMPRSAGARTNAIEVRPSVVEDVPQLVAMIERRRLRYQTYQPVFWKKAASSAESTGTWFATMIREGVIAFTALEDGKVAGFVFANETREPPIVDPGGVTVTLDDYCVADERRWPDVGRVLLEAVKRVGHSKGWRQIVVISAEKDILKSEFLKASGLSIASTWWTTPL